MARENDGIESNWRDLVYCNNCGFRGTVKKGAEYCPKCDKSGVLSWQDENSQEIEV